MKKVINLLELNTVCNKCQNQNSYIKCNCKRSDSENINYGNTEDCYSIYSNFCEIHYKPAQAQPKVAMREVKENISSFYLKADTLERNKTVSVPYDNLMSQYYRGRSKKFR